MAVRRFRSAAVWLEALLTNIPFRLQHTIYASTPVVPLTRMRVEFDASPWGGGAVLWVDGQVSEFAILKWTKEDRSHDSVRIGVAADQTYWEFATSSAKWSTCVSHRSHLCASSCSSVLTIPSAYVIFF